MIRKFLIIFILFISLIFSSFGATYWTDNQRQGASDSNSCLSESAPCLTIQGGVDKLNAGDTLNVKEGTYYEDNQNSGWYISPGVRIYKSGTSSNPIIVQAAPSHEGNVIIDLQNVRSGILIENEMNHIHIKNFKIINSLGSAIVSKDIGSPYFSCQDNNDWSYGLLIEGNYIENVNSNCFGCNGAGMRLYGVRDSIVRNNRINKMVDPFESNHRSGIQSYAVFNITIENNFISDVSNGVYWKANPKNCNLNTPQSVIKNNLIVNVSEGAIFMDSGRNSGHYNILKNNILKNFNIGFWIGNDDAGKSYSGVTEINNNFLDNSGNANYFGIVHRISEYSPKISILGNIFHGNYKHHVQHRPLNGVIEDHNFNIYTSEPKIEMHTYQSGSAYNSLLSWQNSGVVVQNSVKPDENSLIRSVNTVAVNANDRDYTIPSGSDALGLLPGNKNAGPYENGDEIIGLLPSHFLNGGSGNNGGDNNPICEASSTSKCYYVSNSGSASWNSCNDINSPCSPQTAMQNAQAGDIVYFRGGQYDLFFSTPLAYKAILMPSNSGTELNPIIFKAYPNELPILNAIYENKVSGIADSDSSSYLLKDNSANFISSGVKYLDTVYNLDKGVGGMVNSVIDENTIELLTAGVWGNSLLENGDNYIIYVDSIGVIGNGDEDYIHIDGFKVQGEGGLTGGKIVIAGHNKGSDVYGNEIRNVIVDGGSRKFVHGDNREGIRIEDTVDTKIQNSTVYNFNYINLGGHNIGAIKTYFNKNMLIENNEIYNSTSGIYLKLGTKDSIIRNNYIHDTWKGINGHFSCKSSHNPCKTTENNIITNNLITNNEYVGISIEGKDTQYGNININIYDNTIHFSDSSGTIGINIQQGYGSNIYNNILSNANNQLNFAYNNDYNIATTDHNIFSNSFYIGTHSYPTIPYTSLSSWQSSGELSDGSNPGVGSLNQNPLFTNPSGNFNQISDFKLSSNSPAKNAGRNGEDMGANIDCVGVGASSCSGVVNPPQDNLAPTKPTLNEVSKTLDSITLNWGASSDDSPPITYSLYKDGSPVTSIQGLSYEVQGLEPSTSYSFYLRATDSRGNGINSDTIVIITNPNIVNSSEYNVTQIVSPEWTFNDNFESTKDSSFWNIGNNVNHGISCISNPSHNSNVMQFNYDQNNNPDYTTSEQRFAIPLNAKQIEMSYKLYVPSNYAPPPYTPGQSSNHKGMAYFWSGAYGHSASNIAVSSENWPCFDNSACPSVYIGVDGTNFGHLHMPSDKKVPMLETGDGKWHDINVYLELADNQNDYGIFELYKNGELITGTHHPDIISLQSSPPSTERIRFSNRGNYIDKGYILGWANNGFTESTYFCIDDFSIKASSEIGETQNNGNTNPPVDPPTNPQVTISVDSTYDSASYNKDDLYDGDIDSDWASTGSSTDEHWIEFDFGEIKSISNLTVYWGFNSFQNLFMEAQEMQILSYNGNSYNLINTIGSTGNSPSTFTSFPTIETQVLRLKTNANKGNINYSTVLWVGEVEFGFGESNPDPEPAVCGNDIVEIGETCDDGNIITEICPYGSPSCTVCSSTCKIVTQSAEYCGDGIIQSENGEDCDGDSNLPLCIEYDSSYDIGSISCSNTCSYDISSCESTAPDTFPPKFLTLTPMEEIFDVGTTQVLLSFTTDEISSCKYSTNRTFNFNTAGNIISENMESHNITLTNLTIGEYKYFIKCIDLIGNTNTDDEPNFISFSIPEEEVTPPDNSGGGNPSSSGRGGGSGGSSRNNDKPSLLNDDNNVCVPDYNALAWSNCLDGEQRRLVLDDNSCVEEKTETRKCSVRNTEIQNKFLNAKEIDIQKSTTKKRTYNARLTASYNEIFKTDEKLEDDSFVLVDGESGEEYLGKLVEEDNGEFFYSLERIDENNLADLKFEGLVPQTISENVDSGFRNLFGSPVFITIVSVVSILLMIGFIIYLVVYIRKIHE